MQKTHLYMVAILSNHGYMNQCNKHIDKVHENFVVRHSTGFYENIVVQNAYQYGTSGIFNQMLCHKHP